jgi:hypothetical protein
MSFQYKAGLNNVGSYQISGIPYASASINVPASAADPIVVIFPSVTQKIMVHNHDAANVLRVGFSANGVKGTNYWIIDNEDANGKGKPYVEMKIRTDRIYLLGMTNAVTSAVVYAELTGITPEYNIAASYSGSNGIG